MVESAGVLARYAEAAVQRAWKALAQRRAAAVAQLWRFQELCGGECDLSFHSPQQSGGKLGSNREELRR